MAIVVLNYNGLDDTLKCLESLKALRGQHNTVVLVDNASTIDPEPSATRAYPGLHVLHNDTNLGYAGGNNRGVQFALASGAQYVLVLNNDTIVAPRLVERLVETFNSNPLLGIVGPVINYMDEPDRVMTDGTRFNPGPGAEFFRRVVVPVAANRDEAPTHVDIVNGCCIMIRADVLRRVGLFDERLFIVHEESDLCLRAQAAGIQCGVIPETLVWHRGSSSFDRTGRDWQRYFDTRNLLYLILRYSGRVGSSRGRPVSLFHYLRYVYYRHETEIEAGQRAAAQGVLDGLCDAILGQTGGYSRGPRKIARLARLTFAVARLITRAKRLLTRGRNVTEPSTDGRGAT